MSDYEATRQRHVARALTLAPLLIEQLDWPAERLAEHRIRISASWCGPRPSGRRGTASACPESTSTAWTRRP